MKNLTKSDLFRTVLEIFTVFLGVTIAFGLNQWNENQNKRTIEIHTLKALNDGLKLDKKDIELNIYGHNLGLEACDYFGDYVHGKTVPSDTLTKYFSILLRDFISIQNSAAYESLKSQGSDTISNDSLRLEIISLYDIQFESIEKIEENYQEMQFHKSYFEQISDILADFILYDKENNLIGFETPIKLSSHHQKKILLYLSKIKFNRLFTLREYASIEKSIEKLEADILHELKILQ